MCIVNFCLSQAKVETLWRTARVGITLSTATGESDAIYIVGPELVSSNGHALATYWWLALARPLSLEPRNHWWSLIGGRQINLLFMQAEVSGIGNVVSVEGKWDSLLLWLRDENEVHCNRYKLRARSAIWCHTPGSSGWSSASTQVVFETRKLTDGWMDGREIRVGLPQKTQRTRLAVSTWSRRLCHRLLFASPPLWMRNRNSFGLSIPLKQHSAYLGRTLLLQLPPLLQSWSLVFVS